MKAGHVPAIVHSALDTCKGDAGVLRPQVVRYSADLGPDELDAIALRYPLMFRAWHNICT